jgi:hypothetical protein
VDAATQLRNQESDLLALVGRRLIAGWTGWDLDLDRRFSDIPLALVFDGGVQVELAWARWDALSITWNTIDLAVPPEILDRPSEWRLSQRDPVAAIGGRTLTAFATTESPYFSGDADLIGMLPVHAVAGRGIQGTWIEFGDTGLHVYSGGDTTGLSADPPNRRRRDDPGDAMVARDRTRRRPAPRSA